MSNEQSFLVGYEIFTSLDATQRTTFQKEAISRSYPKGAFITQYGDIWPYLFILTRGQVNAIKESSEGRSLSIATFKPGDIFWGLAFFHEEAPMPVTLETTEETSLFLWPRERVLPVILQNGQFSWELSRLMVKLMLRASAIVDELAFQPVAGRVARLLLENFPSDQDSAPRHLTLDEMAARVGTTREMVCRVLYRFAEQGAIQINRTEFIFTDRSLLEEHTRRG
ncbi:MAG: Crp/Fnr family transcriptional regulator [Anaerolineales bacterium]|nr:Crp/Fnr family transcriptional regulator [Anaerolineales bacterium]